MLGVAGEVSRHGQAPLATDCAAAGDVVLVTGDSWFLTGQRPDEFH
ncbi:MAG: hypothetical protein MUD11_07460 [Rhodobacteraceae bacterium]|nr:hypothetical protein [Paracoccaceae bacterium]